uniref:Uncharacterized protein n=1 Tax=Candidatus Kentrum sp. LFY TaxID=2126342 RepID=A0A450WC72_9GAMM|nr:MAG: hypothetical protein BECKLFY1418C_GA0070996_100948 [Candidatus Kentron sp. LFY]
MKFIRTAFSKIREFFSCQQVFDEMHEKVSDIQVQLKDIRQSDDRIAELINNLPQHAPSESQSEDRS